MSYARAAGAGTFKAKMTKGPPVDEAVSQQPLPSDGDRALAELAAPLAALGAGSIVRPGSDPHAAAVTAVLVADYLGQPILRAKLASVALAADAPAQLTRYARAMLAVVSRLGGNYLPEREGVAKDLVERGSAARSALIASLGNALPKDAELAMWVDAVRLSTGVVELVYDLRTLADLSLHRAELAKEPGVRDAAAAARSAAIALELALRAGETPAHAQARNTLARLWTLFVPAYERAAAAGRALTRDEGHERRFPLLALIASQRRARRRPLSLPPPGARHKPTVPPRRVGSKPELLPVEQIEEIEAVEDVADAPANQASDIRKVARDIVEIEVGIASQSNFYQGFTENLSSGGVFVATYAVKKAGAKVDIVLAFPNGEELRVPGVVRWLREATADAWPGMGVQFETLSPEDEAKIRKFTKVRDPLFYEE